MSNESASTIFLSYYLETIGGAKQVHQNFNISRIPTDRISNYYKNILLTWAEYTNIDPIQQPETLFKKKRTLNF